MAEQLINEFTVNLPVDDAWTVLTDIERIAPCLPGAELHEIADEGTNADGVDTTVYRGVVKIKLGSIAPQFKGQAQFLERDDDVHRAVIKAEGRDTGGRGTAAAQITASAESLSPTSTKVVVTTDLHITGKVAQFSRGIIGDVSRKLMEQFSGNLNQMLDQSAGAGAPTAATSSSQAGVTTAASNNGTHASPHADTDRTDPDMKSDDGPGPDAATGPAGDRAGSSTTAAPETPRVRRIEGPASEPVDLADVAGPAILKRLAPLVAVIVVAVSLVRKRH